MTKANPDVSAAVEEIQKLHSEAEAGRQKLKKTVDAMIRDASRMIDAIVALKNQAVISDIGATGERLLNALMVFDRELHAQDAKSERVETGLQELGEKIRALLKPPALTAPVTEPLVVAQKAASVTHATPQTIVRTDNSAASQSVARHIPMTTSVSKNAATQPNATDLAVPTMKSAPESPKMSEKAIRELMEQSLVHKNVRDGWQSGQSIPSVSFSKIPKSVVAEVGRVIRTIDMQDPAGRTMFGRLYNFTEADVEICLKALRASLPTPLPSETAYERNARHEKAKSLGYELIKISPEEAYESVLAAVPHAMKPALEARKSFRVVNEFADVDPELQKEVKRIFEALKYFEVKRREFLRTYFFTETQLRRWKIQGEFPVVKPETLRDVWSETEAAKPKPVAPLPEAPVVPKADDPVPPQNTSASASLPEPEPTVDDPERVADLESALGRKLDSFPEGIADDLRKFSLEDTERARYRRITFEACARGVRIFEVMKESQLLATWLAHLGVEKVPYSEWKRHADWFTENESLLQQLERELSTLQLPEPRGENERIYFTSYQQQHILRIDRLLSRFPYGAIGDFFTECALSPQSVCKWKKKASTAKTS